ncbi:MAG: lysine--tRNA ligase [Fimbriimonadaceae bacterium]
MSTDADIRDIRLQKLARLREIGLDPFRVERFDRSVAAIDVHERYEELAGKRVSFAGRVVSYRLMGKAGFAHIGDGDGKVQAYFRRDDLSETEWEAYNLLDIGDHVGVEGEVFLTKTGEKSIHVRKLVPLSKSLHVLPLGKEKDGRQWYGLSDVETRYRHRHLDLICNPAARRMLIQRMKVVSAVRRFFDSRGYLEVETPVLQLEAGGAAARPFLTHHNALDIDMKLRISLELYLKRLICGDLPKVYEIGRVFRNEGISNRHNPEFTLLEFYEAYANLEDMMTVVEELFRRVAVEVFGSASVEVPADPARSPDAAAHTLDFSKPWRRVSLLAEIERHTGLSSDDLSDLATAVARSRELDVPGKARAVGATIDLDKEGNLGGYIEKLLEVFVEPTLQEPTFVVGYPIETSPLAKKDPENPRMTRRFEGYVLGREVCNAFSEINDPIDQRERFEQQLSERAKGDDEAHPMDEEFIYALECGMPPTGGCGIGIDRLAMILTGADHIREIVLFPTMRPEKKPEEDVGRED